MTKYIAGLLAAATAAGLLGPSVLNTIDSFGNAASEINVTQLKNSVQINEMLTAGDLDEAWSITIDEIVEQAPTAYAVTDATLYWVPNERVCHVYGFEAETKTFTHDRCDAGNLPVSVTSQLDAAVDENNLGGGFTLVDNADYQEPSIDLGE